MYFQATRRLSKGSKQYQLDKSTGNNTSALNFGQKKNPLRNISGCQDLLLAMFLKFALNF